MYFKQRGLGVFSRAWLNFKPIGSNIVNLFSLIYPCVLQYWNPYVALQNPWI
jgi:hypothetical protein